MAAAADACASSNNVRVFEELRRLVSEASTGDGAADAQADDVLTNLGPRDLEELRQMKNPPVVVRRTLEATYLLLNAMKVRGKPVAPPWERVQRMLSDAQFRARMLNFEAGVLQAMPHVVSYVVGEYFGCGAAGAGSEANGGSPQASPTPSRASLGVRAPTLTRSSSSSSRGSLLLRRTASSGVLAAAGELTPLTFQRVARASRAAGALFTWSAIVLARALECERSPPPAEAEAEQEEEVAQDEPFEAEEEVSLAAVPVAPLAPAAVQVVVLRCPAAQRAPEPAPEAPPESLRTTAPAAAPKPVTRPPPPRPLAGAAPPAADAKPDRHFEILISFELGRAAFGDLGEHSLQTVAATLCMRKRLVLALVSSPAPIENAALAKGRVHAVEEWFLSYGITPERIGCPSEVLRAADDEQGVVCRLVLDEDRHLRDFYLLSARGEAPDACGTRDTQGAAQWLEDSFQMRMLS